MVEISFKTLDKALWIYPDVCMNNANNFNNKNYLEICEKLKELKIVDHPALDEA